MVLAGSRRRKASSRNASSRKTHRVRSSRGGRRSRIRRGGWAQMHSDGTTTYGNKRYF